MVHHDPELGRLTGGSDRLDQMTAAALKGVAFRGSTERMMTLGELAVRHGMEYVDPGASFYETRYRKRLVHNLHRRAKAFGFVLQPMEPISGVVS